jgi:hypothetical protein
VLATAAMSIQWALAPGGFCLRTGDRGVRVVSRNTAIWVDRVEHPESFWSHEHEGLSWMFDPFYGDPIILKSDRSLSHALGFARFEMKGFVRTEIPLWPLVLAGMAGGIRYVMIGYEWERRRAKWRGRCHGCGYDLRATPERCPECGMSRASGKSARSSN